MHIRFLQKANEKATQLEAKLAEYATKTELKNGLAAKADKTELQNGLALKADKTELQNGLALKADKTELEAAVKNLTAKIAEVAKLETRIEALEKAKAELTALVASKVDQKAYDAKVAEIEGRLTSAESKVTLVTNKANTLEQTLTALKNKVDNQLVALDKFNEKVAALDAKDADLQKQIDALKKTVNEEVAALKKDVKALQDAGFQTEAQVDAKVKKVSDRVDVLEERVNMLSIAKVTSLVFEPTHFEDGIESIFSAEYLFKALTKLDKADDKGVVDFKTEAEVAADVTTANYAEATYHVNPSNAKVDTNKENFAFLDLRSTTRAAAPAVTVESVKLENGKLVVGFHNNLPAETPAAAGQLAEINVVALSYTEKDDKTARAVVSDYARVVNDLYENLRIGKATEDEILAPLYLKKAGVINLKDMLAAEKEDRTFTVLNDGTPAKLAEQVRSYGENEGALAPIDENAASESELKDAGFHYEYALVKDGAADKSTEIFTIDPKTGDLKVAFDEEKPYQHLGKTVKVRVTLVDAAGKVASVGYFYARVASPAKVVATVVNDSELKAVCDKTSAHPNLVVDLEPLTKYLAKNFGMAEADVWKNGPTNNFTILTPGGFHQQYTVKDNVAEVVPVAKRLGNLVRSVDANGKNILTWSGLTEEKVANLRKAGETASVILQVVKKDDQKNVVLYFEVKGFLPGTVQNPVLDPAKYTTDIQATASAWRFVQPRVKQAKGTDGKHYLLGVSNDGKYFTATEMDGDKPKAGAVAVNIAEVSTAGVITYQNNDVAKKLLNYAGYNELKDGQTLTARVAYVTTVCSGKKVLKVTDATKKYAEFDVKFIRPLNVNYTGNVVFGDANQAHQEAEIKFDNATSDWRNVSNMGQLTAAYGALSVGFAPNTEWTTDLNGGDVDTQKLVATFGSTYGVSVAATPAGTASTVAEFTGYTEYAFGTYPKLQYVTNTANLKQFTIRIPVYVKYFWGEIKSHIDVKVGKTLNQGNARRK